MVRTLANIPLILLFFKTGIFIKIFEFNISPTGNISYASPEYKVTNNDNEISKPFTFCGSFKASSLSGESFFTFYGEDGEPWLGFSIWPSIKRDKLVMWLRIRSSWRRVRDGDLYWLNFWTHACFLVDATFMEIKVSVNGLEPVSVISEELLIGAPKDIKKSVMVGKSDQNGPNQFVGSVTNIFLIENSLDLNIKEMSGNLCTYKENTWKDSQWLTKGNVVETKKDDNEVCRQNDIYRIAVPINMTWTEGIEICQKLGSGRMTEVEDGNDLELMIKGFDSLKSHCTRIWTPHTDNVKEGSYKNAITGEDPSYLPWDTLEPDGLEEQNYAVIDTASMRYKDIAINIASCVSCDLNISTQFYLTGLCEDTFLDSVYFVNNDDKELEYKGMHTTIR